eukprot:PhM_4_TR307/c1_g1_i1/m.13703
MRRRLICDLEGVDDGTAHNGGLVRAQQSQHVLCYVVGDEARVKVARKAHRAVAHCWHLVVHAQHQNFGDVVEERAALDAADLRVQGGDQPLEEVEHARPNVLVLCVVLLNTRLYEQRRFGVVLVGLAALEAVVPDEVVDAVDAVHRERRDGDGLQRNVHDGVRQQRRVGELPAQLHELFLLAVVGARALLGLLEGSHDGGTNLVVDVGRLRGHRVPALHFLSGEPFPRLDGCRRRRFAAAGEHRLALVILSAALELFGHHGMITDSRLFRRCCSLRGHFKTGGGLLSKFTFFLNVLFNKVQKL